MASKTLSRRGKTSARKKVKTMARPKKRMGTIKKTSRKTLAKKIAKKVTKKLIKRAASVKLKPSPVLGRVVHYYDRIGVAVLELAGSVRLGDVVLFRRGDEEFTQVVSSLQIDHVPVQSAAKGQDVGMKVDRALERGALMLRT